MYRPKEVIDRLGISSTTLRRWCATFAEYLSPTAGSAITASGGPAQRRFTDEDVALLAAIQRELASKRTVDEVLIRLRRGAITPDSDVADHNNIPETQHLASTEPPTGEALVLVGGSSPTDLQKALAQLVLSAPQISGMLAESEASLRALRDSHETQLAALASLESSLEAQTALLQELRAEREALAAARAELQALRDSPLVPNLDRGGPQAPMTWGQRVKRLFTGEP